MTKTPPTIIVMFKKRGAVPFCIDGKSRLQEAWSPWESRKADSRRRPYQLTFLTYPWQSFSSQGKEFSFSSVGGDEVDAFSFGNTACQGCLSAIGMVS